VDVRKQVWILQEKVLGKLGFQARLYRKSLMLKRGAGKGNRTLIASLEGWSFTIKLCPRLRALVRVNRFPQISSGKLGKDSLAQVPVCRALNSYLGDDYDHLAPPTHTHVFHS
jgi:hypothetical protein